jgi:hypothetical protein
MRTVEIDLFPKPKIAAVIWVPWRSGPTKNCGDLKFGSAKIHSYRRQSLGSQETSTEKMSRARSSHQNRQIIPCVLKNMRLQESALKSRILARLSTFGRAALRLFRRFPEPLTHFPKSSRYLNSLRYPNSWCHRNFSPDPNGLQLKNIWINLFWFCVFVRDKWSSYHSIFFILCFHFLNWSNDSSMFLILCFVFRLKKWWIHVFDFVFIVFRLENVWMNVFNFVFLFFKLKQCWIPLFHFVFSFFWIEAVMIQSFSFCFFLFFSFFQLKQLWLNVSNFVFLFLFF